MSHVTSGFDPSTTSDSRLIVSDEEIFEVINLRCSSPAAIYNGIVRLAYREGKRARQVTSLDKVGRRRSLRVSFPTANDLVHLPYISVHNLAGE